MCGGRSLCVSLCVSVCPYGFVLDLSECVSALCVYVCVSMCDIFLCLFEYMCVFRWKFKAFEIKGDTWFAFDVQ